MKNFFLKNTRILLLVIASFLLTISINFHAEAQSNKAKVFTLTQTGCQFVETEAKNYNYAPKTAQDCRQINSNTLKNREKSFKTISLAAGEYNFKVTNQNVPYELGFYLRGQGASQFLLPKVSGGGLTKGKTKLYNVNLKKGKYYISCPLNPTPDYPLIVK